MQFWPTRGVTSLSRRTCVFLFHLSIRTRDTQQRLLPGKTTSIVSFRLLASLFSYLAGHVLWSLGSRVALPAKVPWVTNLISPFFWPVSIGFAGCWLSAYTLTSSHSNLHGCERASQLRNMYWPVNPYGTHSGQVKRWTDSRPHGKLPAVQVEGPSLPCMGMCPCDGQRTTWNAVDQNQSSFGSEMRSLTHWPGVPWSS